MFNQISGHPVTQSSWHSELIIILNTTFLQRLPHYSAPLSSKTQVALPDLPFALDLTQWVFSSTLSHPSKCHSCLQLAQAKLCLPYRLLPELMVCLCEFLNSSASPAGQNRFQGSSCQLSTYLSLLLQIKGLLGLPPDVPCTLKKYVWLYSHEICHWEHLSLHLPSLCLSFTLWQLFSVHCGSGLQVSPGFIRDGAFISFISFNIVFVTLRVISKKRKKKRSLSLPQQNWKLQGPWLVICFEEGKSDHSI